MVSIQDQIKNVEDEIRKTSYNKSTSFHIGRLKAKLSKLNDIIEKQDTKNSSNNNGYNIKKNGDATVTLVGFPSVGKSTLLNKLTNAKSDVGSYAFTTLTVIPGIMIYKGAHIQVLDIPGLVKGASSGKGRGKEVITVIRNSDLILFLLDIFQETHLNVLINELYKSGIRVDQKKPDVVIKKTNKGGIQVNSTVPINIDENTIKEILDEYKIHNASIVIRENINIDQLIDVITNTRSYIPSITIINKVDLANPKLIDDFKEKYPNSIFISANNNENIEELKEKLYEKLEFIQIYLKPQGKNVDIKEPMIVLKNTNIKQICERLHRDFIKKFRFAYVWGKSAKHPGQRVGLDHILFDKDIVTIIIRK